MADDVEVVRRAHIARLVRAGAVAIAMTAAGALVTGQAASNSPEMPPEQLDQSRTSSPGTASGVVEQYLEAVIDRDYARAWNLLCVEHRYRLPKAQFAAEMTRSSAVSIERYRITSGREASTGATVAGVVGYSIATESPFTASLVRRADDAWGVCSVHSPVPEVRSAAWPSSLP